jgi:ribA/ribD-fused uncharacterized protein
MNPAEVYGFFGQHNTLSNFYESKIEIDGKTFNCVEQFYQYAKAAYFRDHYQGDAIMATTDPKEQKRLGQKICGFVRVVWNAKRESIMWKGLLAKFTQNQWCRKSLLSTGTKRLCEASIYDSFWGAGIGLIDWRLNYPEHWTGENQLGNMLEEIRDNL